MTSSEARSRLMVGALISIGINAAVTVGGYMIGAKFKHPVAGALIGFFFVGPSINAPVFFAFTSEAMQTLYAERAAGQPSEAPRGLPRMP